MLIAGALVATLLAALGVTTGYAYAGEVPRGTVVLDIDLGGKNRAEAAAALRAELDRRNDVLAAPVKVQLGDQTTEINPADVSLAIDVDATVAAAVDTRPGPFSRLFGARKIAPVIRVDQAKLEELLQPLAAKAGAAMTMPAVRFEGTRPKPIYPKPGTGLDPERAAQVLRDGWLSAKTVVVPLVEVHPATSAADVDRLITEFAEPAVSGPVTVTTERGSFTVSPGAIAKSLVLAADKTGKIEPRIDAKKLRAALGDQLGKVEIKPKNATMAIVSGKPRITPGNDGQEIDLAALSRDLLTVLPNRAGREVKGVLKTVPATTTADELAGLGIKERVSTFTTKFTGGLSSPRSQNIVRVAQQVDNTLVKPGEVFSLNRHTGERGYAQGYRDAPVILNGKLVPGVGGGVSQFTTTLFNAVYYAGLEDVEHKPHSYYYSRYPAVIESTIFYPDLDFKFRNNTPHGVLIDTSYTSDSITVSIWSTKIYDSVKTEYGPRRNITQPKTVYLTPGPTCIAAAGSTGFTQDAFRVIKKDGKVVKREKFTWTYDPEPNFVCGPKP
ncbi:MAG TPA: VanW family protein [Micromonosporaceae bacterium]